MSGLSDQNFQKVKRLYDKGYKQHEIVKLTGFTRQSIYQEMKKRGHINDIIIKTYFNQDFLSFKKPEYAYLLGWLASDGHVNKDRILLSIQNRDYINIEHVLDACGVWSKRIIERKFPHQSLGSATINQSKISRELITLGLGTEKTLSTPLKIIQNIPIKYHHLFLRGYIDGDGCWYTNYKTKYKFEIWAHEAYNWSYFTEWFTKLGINCRIYRNKNSIGGHSWLGVYSQDGIKNIGKYIYQDHLHLKLDRKYQKYQDILKIINRPKYQHYSRKL